MVMELLHVIVNDEPLIMAFKENYSSKNKIEFKLHGNSLEVFVEYWTCLGLYLNKLPRISIRGVLFFASILNFLFPSLFHIM